MQVSNMPRLVGSSAIGVMLALLLAAQALSSVSTRTAPALAVSLFPANGIARQELAFTNFTAAASDPENIAIAAQAASGLATDALRSEPLAARGYVILALAQPDEAKRRGLVEAMTRVNRRDLALQGMALQQHLADSDYPRTIDTLDQILRVHPKYSDEFFPVLTQALAIDETIPEFARMLDGSSPWHGRFLTYAVGKKETLRNLASLRQQIEVDDENFDRRLIAGLVGAGDVDSAEGLFRHITGAKDSLASSGKIDWKSAYPPFEWQLWDQPGFRAQTSQDGDQLELSVRPGKGGLVAARLLRAPAVPFEIRVAHRIAPSEQVRDVRLQLTCANATVPFYDERLSGESKGFRIQALPADCDHFLLGINARAWSGRSALGGTIDSIEIVPLSGRSPA